LRKKREQLEASALEYKQFQDELNAMFNWINNIHLDLVKQYTGSSSSSSSAAPGIASPTPTVTATAAGSPDATPRASPAPPPEEANSPVTESASEHSALSSPTESTHSLFDANVSYTYLKIIDLLILSRWVESFL
jgi:hypothetical protein